MEGEERQKKLEAGKAKLAEYRQRKAQAAGQGRPEKRKKGVRTKKGEEVRAVGKQTQLCDSVGGHEAPGTGFAVSRTLHREEPVKQEPLSTTEPDSDVSTTGEDYTSEVNGCLEMTKGSGSMIMEEDLHLTGFHPECDVDDDLHGEHQSMEEGLSPAKQDMQEMCVDGMRSAANEGLQDFEVAIKHRDEIITQLTANLQQARKEKDEMMREFLEMTEQSQKLQLQFQQLQAGETLRNSSHSSTAADLLLAKQQILGCQQQINERDYQIKYYREKSEEQLLQMNALQGQLIHTEKVAKAQEIYFTQQLNEKNMLIAERSRTVTENEALLEQLQQDLYSVKRQHNNVNEQLTTRTKELETCKIQLSASQQKEIMSSGEIQELMGTVEDLQRQCHKGSQSESDVVQLQVDVERKMDQLRAELDEMYGQQIVHIKQELHLQHGKEIEKLVEFHSSELEQIKSKAIEDNAFLQEQLHERELQQTRAEEELTKVSQEKMNQQNQIEHLLQNLQRTRITGKLGKIFHNTNLTDVNRLQEAISDLLAQLSAAEEATKELESSHDSEITNYKIKLDMLEREKDAVLDRMAESQEAELDRLRTQLLFSHEEELSQLKEDLQRENQLNIENVKDELMMKHNRIMENLQKSLEEQLQLIKCQNIDLATERDSLVLEIVTLKEDSKKSLENATSVQLKLQVDVHELRKKEKDGRMLEEKIQELIIANEQLEKQANENRQHWECKCRELEGENILLKENNVETLKLLEENNQKMNILAVENDHMNKKLIELLQENDQQRNTLSFAEKNFEFNYKELKDEYACLISVKTELEEKIRKEASNYESKLQNLELKIQKLQEEKKSFGEGRTKKKHKEKDEGNVKKERFQLVEKLDRIQRENGDLQLRLARLGEQLAEKTSQVELLEGKLKAVKEENKQIMTNDKDAQLCLSSGVSSDQPEFEYTNQHHLGKEQKNWEHQYQVRAFGTMPSETQTHIQHLKAGMEEQDMVVVEQSTEVSQEKLMSESFFFMEMKEKEIALFVAQQEIFSLKEKLKGLSDREGFIEASAERRLEHNNITEEELSLQMEAQRLSLSQIHGAQLELLKESQQAEARSRDVELSAAHCQEIKQLREEHQRELRDLEVYVADLKEQLKGRSACLEDLDLLRSDYQKQVGQVQEQHLEEIKRLRDDYQQQAEDAEERHMSQLLRLQQRLEETTGHEALLRESGIPRRDEEHTKRDLQGTHSGLYETYLEDLSAVKEHHGDEMRQTSEEWHHHESTDTSELHPLEREYRHRIEEEIAKVIVQMSVEFAQQTELARALQAASPESEFDVVEVGDDNSNAGTEPKLRELEQRFTVAQERLEEEVKAKSAEILLLKEQLRLVKYSMAEESISDANVCHKQEQLEVTDTSSAREHQLQGSIEDVGGNKATEDQEARRVYDREEADLSQHVVTTERRPEHKAAESVRQALSAVLKTTAAAEELADSSCRWQQQQQQRLAAQRSAEEPCGAASGDAQSTVSLCLGNTATELFQQIHSDASLDHEEHLMNISCCLQAAVGKLQVALQETATQLDHARVTQTELMRESFRHSQEVSELMKRQDELQERLAGEANARQQLALELHKAEGLIDGYTEEKFSLEAKVCEKEELRLQLEQELQLTGKRLQELEQQRGHGEKERLSQQQEAPGDGATPRELRLVEAAVDAAPEADLLEETEKLMKEKVEVQLQAEKDSSDLIQQIKLLEGELEERVTKMVDLEQAHLLENSDLRQQIHGLEKQLESNRRFLDEQAVDREHERDVFQQEIMKLELQLKNPVKHVLSNKQQNREVDQLSAQLKEKSECCSKLLQDTEQLQREAHDRNVEMEKLELRVRELEQSLVSAEKVEQMVHEGLTQNTEVTCLQSQLQTEREALERKEKEISNLEEQLEQFREELENKSEEVQQLQMQLEIQRKELNTHQEEMAQTSNLQMVIEEKNALLKELEFQIECLRTEQEHLKRNTEDEIYQLNEVIEKLQHELSTIEHKTLHEYSSYSEEAIDHTGKSEPKVDFDESLLEKYKCLTDTLVEKDNERVKLVEKLQEQTAAALVLQAEIQALEQSTNSKVSSLHERMIELEMSVKEKDSQLNLRKLQVEQVQTEAGGLKRKVSDLEEELRDKIAALLVRQAELDALQELQTKDLYAQVEDRVGLPHSVPTEIDHLEGDVSKPHTHRKREFEELPLTNVDLLMERLQEIQDCLTKMQDNDDLHKQLSEVSEEDMMEYEMRLATLLNLLTNIWTKPAQETVEMSVKSLGTINRQEVPGNDSAASSQLAEEIQEGVESELRQVRREAAATKEKLTLHLRQSDALKQELRGRDLTLAQLQEKLEEVQDALEKSQEELTGYKRAPHISSPELGGGAQARWVTVADAEVQAQLQPTGAPDVSGLLRDYADKIGQMQELHAAEIMDMETRHISESDALKQDAQLLRDECQALQATVEKLRRVEASRFQQAPRVRDGNASASESSSDWSQHTDPLPALLQLRTTTDEIRGNSETCITPDCLPDRIKSLLREVHQEGMQVLSLSELPALDGVDWESIFHSQEGERDKEGLLSVIESLKTLITKMQTYRVEQPVVTPEEETLDWRAELLKAVQQVFIKESSVLKTNLYSHMEHVDTSDPIIHIKHLEDRLYQQDALHRDAVEKLQTADRTSILMEIQHLKAQLDMARQEANRCVTQRRPATSSQVEGVVAVPQGCQCVSKEPQSLRSDEFLQEELRSDLSQTKMELEVTLKALHIHLKELEIVRNEVTEKGTEIERLNDVLAEEQKRSRELQWTFEKEKCKSDKRQSRDREELEDMKLALENQENHVSLLNKSLNQEQEKAAKLQQHLDNCLAQLSQEKSRVLELQVQLESAHAQAVELSGTVGDEETQRNPEEASCSQTGDTTLKVQLDEKQVKVVKLLADVERQKLEMVQVKKRWEEETQAHRQERDVQMKDQLELQGQVKELRMKLDREKLQSRELRLEKERFQGQVEELKDAIQNAGPEKAPQTKHIVLTEEGRPSNRTRDWVLQQKMTHVEALQSDVDCSPEDYPGMTDAKNMTSIISRLQLMAAKIKTMANDASNRGPTEDPDPTALAWLHNNVQNVISLLQHLPAVFPVPEGVPMGVPPPGSLTEQLLRQNAELTGFISSLTEEKNDLRNSLLNLEEELRLYRHRSTKPKDYYTRRPVEHQGTVDVLLSSEREVWSVERNRLEKSLRQAQAEVIRLQGENHLNSLRDLGASDTDCAAIRRIYGKYLRAESFRKALIYQKKYLLLLLGGFQECEEATLSLIARMGGQTSCTGADVTSHRQRGLSRFRSAVRVSIALSRMKFLVRRWHRAMGSGLRSLPSLNIHGMGQTAGHDRRSLSPHVHPGGGDAAGDNRGSSRGHTGRESPRSAFLVQSRFHIVSDPGGQSCSHLQNYDPDRALTDYISRLEVLQRRLGTVQSGSYAQLHIGMRR